MLVVGVWLVGWSEDGTETDDDQSKRRDRKSARSRLLPSFLPRQSVSQVYQSKGR